MNNGMISVKDKEVMNKRYAFQKTIEVYKKLDANKPNAIFKSSIERDCSTKNMEVKSGAREFDRSAYGTGATMNSTIKHQTMNTTIQ